MILTLGNIMGTKKTRFGILIEVDSPYTGVSCLHFDDETGHCKKGIDFNHNDTYRCHPDLTYCQEWEHDLNYYHSDTYSWFVPYKGLYKSRFVSFQALEYLQAFSFLDACQNYTD